MQLVEAFFGPKSRKIEWVQPEDITSKGYLAYEASERFRGEERKDLRKETIYSALATVLLIAGAAGAGYKTVSPSENYNALNSKVKGDAKELVLYGQQPIERTIYPTEAEVEEYKRLELQQFGWGGLTLIVGLLGVAAAANGTLAHERRDKLSSSVLKVAVNPTTKNINHIVVNKEYYYYPQPVSVAA